MPYRDDDSFEPRLGRPRSKGGSSQKFISRVLKATSKAGPVARNGVAVKRTAGAGRGRGHVVARLIGDRLSASARRVTVKARLVNLNRAKSGSAIAHLRYIERDGVTPTGERGQAYGPATDEADVIEFERRGAGDRHQFRFIVSPEDAADFGDLKPFTRDLMHQMERDLGTRLEWVAVDHWDTEHPHTHVVLRGKADDGRDLVIARDYIAHGMRVRASEIMTRSLGPRTQQEIEAELAVESRRERWTGLDATLARFETAGLIADRDLTTTASALIHRSVLIGRLERLNTMGLSERHQDGWHMASHWQQTLRSMGERADIIDIARKALGDEYREVAIFDPRHPSPPVLGRIASKGFVNELEDCPYLVIDGLDGHAHYVELPTRTNLASLPVDGILEVRTVPIRASDQAIARMAVNGVYRTERHLALARSSTQGSLDPQTYVEGHVRRLEALRRAGLVERLKAGVWKIPADLVERGRAFDAERSGGVALTLHSHLSVERQVQSLGATWLDRRLLRAPKVIPPTPWGMAVEVALKEREQRLIDEGLALREGTRVTFARGVLQILWARELDAAAHVIERETGMAHRTVGDHAHVSGVYRRSVQLASGRFALLDDGVGFSLVPWRPVLESRLGQSVSATIEGASVSWTFGKSRGVAR